MYVILIKLCLLAAYADAAVAAPAVDDNPAPTSRSQALPGNVEAPANAPALDNNPVFIELVEKGVTMSDGKAYKLPAPAMADGLDAAGQKAVIEKIAGKRYTLEDLMRKSSSAPVVVRVRTLKAAQDEAATVRAIDLWFVAHGKWETLNSKIFLDSLVKGRDSEGENRMVSKSGVLSEEEMQKRNLKPEALEGREAKFVYTTFSLFDQVEISATRYAVITRGKDYLLAAARIDGRFAGDAEYPNQWRPILRDAAANVYFGDAQPYTGAGAYAKITRLAEPAEAIFVEAHIVFEEPYGWFEGGNLLRSKVPVMAQQRVRMFRGKFAIASAKQE
jgi:hypothetical protein